MADFEDYQPEEMAEDITSILAAFVQDNAEAAHTCQNKVFAKLLAEDARAQTRLLDFAFEIIGRLAVSDKKNKAVSVAQLVMAALPTTRQYYPGKKLIKRNNQEYWLTQIRKLNLQYVFAAKALVCMLAQHGELALSRQLFDSIDETTLKSHYFPESDILQFGTEVQAKSWTLGDEIAANPELAKAQQEKFEKESGASFEEATGEGKPIEEKDAQRLLVVEEMSPVSREVFDAAEKLSGNHTKIIGAPTRPGRTRVIVPETVPVNPEEADNATRILNTASESRKIKADIENQPDPSRLDLID